MKTNYDHPGGCGMLDLAIENGEIIDGSGSPRYAGDIGIQGGKIVSIGHVGEPARRTINAADAVVAPGFIDIHTHYDAQAFWDPTLSPSPFHGVTSVIGGNCGFSIAPLIPDRADYLMKMLARVEGMPAESLAEGVPWDWSSTSDFLNRLEGKLTPNSGWMVGHSALRCVAMGEDALSKKSSPSQLETMRALLRDGLMSGAMGFTSSWSDHRDHLGNLVPSRHADISELLALCAVVSEFPGTTLSFAPPLGRFEDDTLELLTRMSSTANRPLNWNVLIAEIHDDDYIANQLSADDLAAKRGGRIVALAAADSRHHRLNFSSGLSSTHCPVGDP